MILQLAGNEITKMLRKRRFQVVLLILFCLAAAFSYAEKQAGIELARQLGTSNYHAVLEQQITSDLNHLNSPFAPIAEKAALQAAITTDQYMIGHNINPYAPGAPSFVKSFMDKGITLLIPMLVIVIASDMVSSEISEGTIKMLLTRGVSRVMVLTGKLVALFVLTAMLIGAVAISAYAVSGVFFGYQGWGLPVLMGFHTSASGYVDLTHVFTIAQWKYLLMSYGLGFFACLSVACLAFMVSTLVRQTASSMGIMIAALIAGSLLTVLASNWTAVKYLPVVNLQLSGYLNGSPPPIQGMTYGFSVTVLAVWSIAALLVSFGVFMRRDVMD